MKKKRKVTPLRTSKSGSAKRRLTKKDLAFLRRLKPISAVERVERMESRFG
jgi:hypothetical protein